MRNFIKVLNASPPQILDMLEEAAGTRVYESKKQNALKTIDKKELKIKDIKEVKKIYYLNKNPSNINSCA